jgi:HlyD family type I secretion membrane fusion protein
MKARAEDNGHADRDAKQSPSASARGTVLGGLALLVAVFGLGGWWAFSTPLESAAVAPAVLTVESKRKSIQHLEGGIVCELLVRDGDLVERGDILIRLDATRAQAQLAIVRAQLDLGQATEARLMAERYGIDTPELPERLAARRDDATVAGIIAGQANIQLARREALTGESDILRQRIEQFREEISGLAALHRAVEQQIRSLRAELDDLRELMDRGYVTRTRVLALQRDIERLEGERASHLAGRAQAELGISEAELSILQLEQSFQQDVEAELAEVRAQNFEMLERIVAAEDVLRRIELLAPVSGTVVGLGVHGPGAVIEPARTLMEIVPSDDPLIVEARVPPMFIESVEVGQRTSVRLITIEQGRTPVVYGRLEMISADRITPARGTDYYRARILIEHDALSGIDSDLLYAGMPAEVLIHSGERTPLDIALKPITDSIDRSSELWAATRELLRGLGRTVLSLDDRVL